MTGYPHLSTPNQCEVCGRYSQSLRSVMIEPGTAVRHGRIIYVCDRHREAAPVPPPRDSTLAGTSRKHPQAESLFDCVTPQGMPS